MMPDPTCKEVSECGLIQRGLAEDKETVDMFASVMLEKMRENRHKAHWSHVESAWLLSRLEDELEELREAMAGDDPLSIVYECADVANFAMMIADKEWLKDGVH